MHVSVPEASPCVPTISREAAGRSDCEQVWLTPSTCALILLWHQDRNDVAYVLCANFTGRNQQKLRGEDDYNMDENEAESETDKQAALAGNDRNIDGKNGAWVGGEVTFHFPFLVLRCDYPVNPQHYIVINRSLQRDRLFFRSLWNQGQWREVRVEKPKLMKTIRKACIISRNIFSVAQVF